MKNDKKVLVDEAFTRTQAIKSCKSDIVKNFLVIGEHLSILKEKKLYGYYASHIKHWKDYCKEIGISVSNSDSLISVFRWFGGLIRTQKVKVLGLDHTRLIQALPLVKTPEDAQHWLHQAIELTSEGYRDALVKAKGGTPQDECDHPPEMVMTLNYCKKCKHYFK